MIAISKASKHFGSVAALRDVSLGIEAGERVALIGANGSGKTTLVRALLGLVRIVGRVTIDGIDVAASPQTALTKVAYIPQIAPPIEATVTELIQAHAKLRLLKNVASVNMAKQLGLNIEDCKAKRFRDLSGGMKQKLLASMALATEAPILVCDEPTANLDGEARAAFFEQLSARAPKSIVVLCSHRIEEVQRIVGRVIELREGQIVRDVPVQDLIHTLKAFRIEVALQEDSNSVRADLISKGFEPCGEGWLGSSVVERDKIAFVTEYLVTHASAFKDLSITPLVNISLNGRTL